MSVSLSIIFETDLPPHGTMGGDHVVLVGLQDRLDRLASKNGFARLGDFVSYDPDDYRYDDDEDLDGEEEFLKQVGSTLPPVQWFPADSGIACVNALLAYLAAHPDTLVAQGKVTAELTSMVAELSDAKRAGVRFRLEVVP